MDLFFPNVPRISLHQNNANRINKRIMALPNANSMLLRAIDRIARLYANATATTQETVSQMSSLNFSSINNNGELLACPCLRDCAKQLPSLFPLVTNGQMHGKWTRLEGNSLLHLEFCVGNGQSQPWSLGS